jgi:rhodanese-related sulfurtransferase
VRFETLVSPRYVTSKSGSSAAALASAAEENGLEVKVLRKMTCDMLRAVTMPVLLHVRSSLLAADYDHWILYLGSTGDRVQIYDGSGNTTTISLASLAARWDGAGLLVSDRPISLMPFYASALLNMFLFANGIVASALLWRRLRAADPAALRCRDRASRRWSFVGEVALLLCFSLWACGSLFLFSPSGYLSDVESIHAIQDRHIADLSPSLTAAELERLLPSKDLLLIDARQARDFRAGSIPGAISIPADASATPERIRQVLSRYPRSTRIVLYCQSLGCQYDEYIGRLLYDAGYDRLSFFSGGWLEWQEMKRKST